MSDVFKSVHGFVKKIPEGKVTTYGNISFYLGINNPRTVGWALHANKDLKVPCHRVVNKDGLLAVGFAFGGWEVQREMLIREGVTFINSKQVDLKKHIWNYPKESSRRMPNKL